jgi:hypothetical protein
MVPAYKSGTRPRSSPKQPEQPKPGSGFPIGADSKKNLTQRIKSEFLLAAKKLLLEDLPNDHVRATFSREKGFLLTPELLRGASTWKEMSEPCSEMAEQLVDLAVASLPFSECEEWVHDQLDSAENGLIHAVDLDGKPKVGDRSVVDHACTILLGRWEIGTDGSQRILSDEIGRVIQQGKVRASIALAKRINKGLDISHQATDRRTVPYIRGIEDAKLGASAALAKHIRNNSANLSPTTKAVGGINRRGAQTDAKARREAMGLRRAKLVKKLISELNALRPHMQLPDDDFPRLSQENPQYETFKICKEHPTAIRWVKLLPDRRTVQCLAWELAAVKCECSASTIQSAWKRYKKMLN